VKRRSFLAGLGAVACTARATDAQPDAVVERAEGFHAGMNLAHLHDVDRGYGSAPSREQMRTLRSLGVTHIALTPFGYQKTVDAPEVVFGDLDRTLTDARLLAEMEHAAAEGLQVCLKPHIWCDAFWKGGKSRQDIEPPDWDRWFASYSAFATHYGKLAQAGGATLFCAGLEYLQATRQKRWSEVAEAVRPVFGGQLTYAANWWEEAEIFEDWKSFDTIGVNAYYPLSEDEDPSLEQLKEGWATHAATLKALSKRHGKDVLFCEAGLRARRGAAAKPWESGWEGDEDNALQARAYEALLATFTPQDWFAGVYWWKWFTDVVEPKRLDPYAPAGREAEAVLRRGWGVP
jgi:hypothetical protein